MLNKDIRSKFHVDDHDYKYKITIKVEGPNVDRQEILENLSFDITGFSFWGLPIENGFVHSQRIIFVSPSPSPENPPHL
jgi:hypothetical protein